MEIKIENKYLVPVNNFLFGLKLKGATSRARTKFLKKVLAKIDEYEEDERAVLLEYANLDDEGEPIVIDGNYDIEDIKGFAKAGKELALEEATISGGEYVNSFEELKKALEKLDVELDGPDAKAYDILMDNFEANTKEEA